MFSLWTGAGYQPFSLVAAALKVLEGDDESAHKGDGAHAGTDSQAKGVLEDEGTKDERNQEQHHEKTDKYAVSHGQRLLAGRLLIGHF